MPPKYLSISCSARLVKYLIVKGFIDLELLA